MLSGQVYDASDPALIEERRIAHAVCRVFNSGVNLSDADLDGLLSILGSSGEGVYIESPFFCDYGYNISLGDKVYFNFNVAILDCAEIVIGNFVKFGPGVQVYTATHSLDPIGRARGDEFALPVVVEENAWIGGSAIILPGVHIGKNSVIGAGSVVIRDIPSDVVAAGNPARVIRKVRAN